MSIIPLPEDVRAKVKSSVEITSLLDVVEGLFKNALDAGPTNVNVTVDFAKGFCLVKDDGSGIPSSEFAHGGRLAQLYCEYIPRFVSYLQVHSTSRETTRLERRLTAQVPQSSNLTPTEVVDDSSSASPLCPCYRSHLDTGLTPRPASQFCNKAP